MNKIHFRSSILVLFSAIVLTLTILLITYNPVEIKRYAIDRSILINDAIKDLGIVRKIAYLVSDPAEKPRTSIEVGDGRSPLEAILHDPTGIYVDENSDIFVSERRHARIRKISGKYITTLAGNGRQGFSGIGVNARLARLNRPEGLDGSEGYIYFSDSFNHRIRMIDPQGTITTIAGTAQAGYSGDGGPANEAQLNAPMDVKRGLSGSLYVLERDNHCVRRISPEGIITTIAGNGFAGFSGDGGLATNAQLNEPYGVAVDQSGNVYIADSKNNRVRKISTDGIITTIAGTGHAGFSGDSGPALEARFDSPQAIYVTPEGSIYVNDEHNNRIRKISPDGIIETVAGSSLTGFSGDGGAATESGLNDPEYIWVDSYNNLFITDGDNNLVRKVSPEGIISTIAGGGKPRLP